MANDPYFTQQSLNINTILSVQEKQHQYKKVETELITNLGIQNNSNLQGWNIAEYEPNIPENRSATYVTNINSKQIPYSDFQENKHYDRRSSEYMKLGTTYVNPVDKYDLNPLPQGSERTRRETFDLLYRKPSVKYSDQIDDEIEFNLPLSKSGYLDNYDKVISNEQNIGHLTKKNKS